MLGFVFSTPSCLVVLSPSLIGALRFPSLGSYGVLTPVLGSILKLGGKAYLGKFIVHEVGTVGISVAVLSGQLAR